MSFPTTLQQSPQTTTTTTTPSEFVKAQSRSLLLKAGRKKLCLLNDPVQGPTLLSVSELIHSTSFAFSHSKGQE